MTLPHPTIIIPARSGSKRLPEKNLMVLGGKTLLQRCIDTAREVTLACGGGRIIVLIDSGWSPKQHIASVEAYATHNVFIVLRPDELNKDDTSTEDLVRWFLKETLTTDPLVLMQCTSPFTTVEHVLECIEAWEQRRPACPDIMAFSDHRQTWRPTGQCYVFSKEATKRAAFFTPVNIHAVSVACPSERRAIDIDTKKDFDDAVKIEQEEPIEVASVSTQMVIPLHLRSTDRADRGHLYPLYEAACKDKRFLPIFSEPGDTKPVHFDEVIFLQGDRTELLYEAAMAVQVGAIIAHAAGGERTKGSTDDCTRDAITKLAHLHYPVHSTAADRLVDLQEEPWRICVAGEIGVDDIKSKPLMSWEDLAKRWPQTFGPQRFIRQEGTFALVAVHPVTNNPEETKHILRLISALTSGFDRAYLSYPNKDPGHELIADRFFQMARLTPDRYCHLPADLGAHAFRSLMKLCGTIIGNSSALITEAPHLGCLPILVGTRQEGRFPSESDGNACGRILDHLYDAVTSRGDGIRTKA